MRLRAVVQQEQDDGTLVWYELTPHLPDREPILARKERERDRFEWIVDDMTLRVSALDGTMEELFEQIAADAKPWMILIFCEDGSSGSDVKFRGIIQSDTVELSVDSMWIDFDVYSINRWVWDRLSEFTARLYIPWNNMIGTYDTVENEWYTTLSEWLTEYVIGKPWVIPTPFYDFHWIVNAIDVESSVDCEMKIIKDGGRIGCFVDLDPELTMADFLREVLKWCNAEMFVLNNTITIRERRSMTPGALKPVDGLVLEDDEPRALYNDGAAIDALRVWTPIAASKPVMTFLDRMAFHDWIELEQEGWLARGEYAYQILYYDGNDVPICASGWLWIETPDRGPAVGFRPTLYVLGASIGAEYVLKRRVWRLNGYNETRWRCVGEISGNNSVSWTDTTSKSQSMANDDEIVLPKTATTCLISWDNGWQVPKLETKSSSTKNVFDVRPQIQFTPPDNMDEVLDLDAGHVLTFFRQIRRLDEGILEWYRKRYINLFSVSKLVTFRVRGIDYEIGDSVYSDVDPHIGKFGQMVIRTAEIDYIGETSTITAACISPGWKTRVLEEEEGEGEGEGGGPTPPEEEEWPVVEVDDASTAEEYLELTL